MRDPYYYIAPLRARYLEHEKFFGWLAILIGLGVSFIGYLYSNITLFFGIIWILGGIFGATLQRTLFNFLMDRKIKQMDENHTLDKIASGLEQREEVYVGEDGKIYTGRDPNKTKGSPELDSYGQIKE